MDWVGPKLLKSFSNAPIRMKNALGNVVATSDRSSDLADHYEHNQWYDSSPPPPLPDRNPLYPEFDAEICA